MIIEMLLNNDIQLFFCWNEQWLVNSLASEWFGKFVFHFRVTSETSHCPSQLDPVH
jgi:hypothetical protein